MAKGRGSVRKGRVAPSPARSCGSAMGQRGGGGRPHSSHGMGGGAVGFGVPHMKDLPLTAVFGLRPPASGSALMENGMSPFCPTAAPPAPHGCPTAAP